MSLAGKELILGVTGSIAAYKAVYLLRELTRALGCQDDEQVAVGHFLEGLLQGREHHSGTSTSGNLSVRRPVRQRSAWMMAAS